MSDEGVTAAHLRMDGRGATADIFRELTDAVLEALEAGHGAIESSMRFMEFTEALSKAELRDVASVLLGRLKAAEKRLKEIES